MDVDEEARPATGRGHRLPWRLVGDRLLGRRSRVLLIRGGTAIAALGTLVILTSHTDPEEAAQ